MMDDVQSLQYLDREGMSFFTELKRRHVVQMGIAYLVLAWSIAQVAELVLDSFESPSWVIQLILLVLAAGFPVALILAWVFELRSGSLRRDSEATATGLDASPDQKQTTQHAEKQSIAVLPLIDLSPEKDQEYFSDGLAEELSNLLSQVAQLRVAARSSAFAYKNQSLGVKEIARQLNVANVLEGSVRKSGSRVRVSAQLIQAETGYQIWSQTWDRMLDDIFAVQDEIAAAVVAHLKVALATPLPPHTEISPDAYALFLQARHLFRQHTPEAYSHALELIERVLRGESYAPALALKSAVCTTQADRGLRSIEEAYSVARRAAQHALEIDSQCALAYDELGWMEMMYQQNLSEAARYIRKALALEPSNPDILRHAAQLSKSLGRIEDAIALEEHLCQIDPVNFANLANLSYSYAAVNRLTEAIDLARTAVRLAPATIGINFNLALFLLADGQTDAASEVITRETHPVYRMIASAMIYHTVGRHVESEAAVKELIEGHSDTAAYNIAYVYAHRHQADETFKWLEEAVSIHDGALAHIVEEPVFNSVRADPRWSALMERLGKSPESLNEVEFEPLSSVTLSS
ncbi:MAG: hypothetical protein AAF709_08045 [Pseudomonadota bacterium]